MIKTSFISPTSLIEKYGNRGDFHLALAHLLGPVNKEPNLYEKTLIESGLPIYLDNGLFENKKSVPMENLIKKAVHLDAEYVFAPDVLFDVKKTEENIGPTYDYLMELKEDFPENKTKLAAVVQADNHQDYLNSYLKMAEDDRVSLIGLSILSIPESFKEVCGTDDITQTRITALELLNGLREKKKSHLLGAGSSYKDVAYANNNCSWVQSHDSSSAIWNGIDDRVVLPDLSIKGGKSPKAVDFDFDEQLSAKQEADILHNIETIRRLTR